MPNNWKTYKLGEIADVQNGYAFKSTELVESGIPVIKIKNIISPNVTIEDVSYFNGNIISQLEKHIVKKGDFLISMTGSTVNVMSSAVGKMGRYRLHNVALINQRVGKIHVTKPDVVSFEYLCQYLNRYDIHYNLAVNATGSANQANISPAQIKDINVFLPSLTEQQAIASILSAIDDKIENNLAINKTLEEMAMALYKHWFVDFGPFQDGKFIESELGMIPKGWEVKNVKDFGIVITGKTPEKKFPQYFGAALPFVTPTDFKDYGKHIISANRKISELGIIKLSKNILPINSVIVTCIGSDMGKVALSKVETLTNQQINSLKTKHYLYMYCFFVNNYSLLKRMAGDGTTMPIINKSSFENIKVIHPNRIILDEFENLINNYDEQILSNTLENQTLNQLRNTLLPKLISGEIRLKEFKKEASTIL